MISGERAETVLETLESEEFTGDNARCALRRAPTSIAR